VPETTRCIQLIHHIDGFGDRKVIKMAASLVRTLFLALTADGQVYCCNGGECGRSDTGQTIPAVTHVQALTGKNVVHVACGSEYWWVS